MNWIIVDKRIRYYYVEEEKDGGFVVSTNLMRKTSFEVFEKAEDAWKHARRLAYATARRRGKKAVYTTHPTDAREIWLVTK